MLRKFRIFAPRKWVIINTPFSQNTAKRGNLRWICEKKEEYIDLTINSMDVSGAKNAVGRHVELAPFAKKERCGRP